MVYFHLIKIVCRPAETATFRALSSDGLASLIDSFSRFTHCLILMIPHCILISIYAPPGNCLIIWKRRILGIRIFKLKIANKNYGQFVLGEIRNLAVILQPENMTNEDYTILHVAKVSYIVLSMMPLLWLLGIFPPLGRKINPRI